MQGRGRSAGALDMEERSHQTRLFGEKPRGAGVRPSQGVPLPGERRPRRHQRPLKLDADERVAGHHRHAAEAPARHTP